MIYGIYMLVEMALKAMKVNKVRLLDHYVYASPSWA